MATPHPQISVLVPCYDDAATLDAALASIAAQSFPDFEAVISDDGSRDGSPAIAEAWAARDARFRPRRNDANLGMTENWNRALAAARGRFVAKLDADDLWRPETLERLYVEHGAATDLSASFCRVDVEEPDGTRGAWPGDDGLRAAGLDPGARHVVRGRALWLASLGDLQLWHSNAFLVLRAELQRLGGFDERWSCASDTALLLRLLGEDRTVAHVPYVGVVYRRRAESVSGRFEARGWKALEGNLVRLDALSRDGGRLAPLPRGARQRWWQAWRDTATAANDPALWDGMPERLREKLTRALAARRPPPRAVRLEGWLRLQGWRARRRRARVAIA